MATMTFLEFDQQARESWLLTMQASYVRKLLSVGISQVEADANAAASYSRTFPDGVPAPGQLAGWAISGHERVGELWVGPNGPDHRVWWVWWVQTYEPYRGKGYGRQLMELCDRLAKENSATALGLQVFANNPIARSLYNSVGYKEMTIVMQKDLN